MKYRLLTILGVFTVCGAIAVFCGKKSSDNGGGVPPVENAEIHASDGDNKVIRLIANTADPVKLDVINVSENIRVTNIAATLTDALNGAGVKVTSGENCADLPLHETCTLSFYAGKTIVEETQVVSISGSNTHSFNISVYVAARAIQHNFSISVKPQNLTLLSYVGSSKTLQITNIRKDGKAIKQVSVELGDLDEKGVTADESNCDNLKAGSTCTISLTPPRKLMTAPPTDILVEGDNPSSNVVRVSVDDPGMYPTAIETSTDELTITANGKSQSITIKNVSSDTNAVVSSLAVELSSKIEGKIQYDHQNCVRIKNGDSCTVTFTGKDMRTPTPISGDIKITALDSKNIKSSNEIKLPATFQDRQFKIDKTELILAAANSTFNPNQNLVNGKITINRDDDLDGFNVNSDNNCFSKQSDTCSNTKASPCSVTFKSSENGCNTGVTFAASNTAIQLKTNGSVLDYGFKFQGGYIFDWKPDDNGGYSLEIVATRDAQKSSWITHHQWCSTSIDNGLQNTNNIIGTDISNRSAAKMCKEYSANISGNSCAINDDTCYTDWYLPAICQMGSAVNNVSGVGKKLSYYPDCVKGSQNIFENVWKKHRDEFKNLFPYWSSSASDSNNAWGIYPNGQINEENTDYQYFVRCVRHVTLSSQ